MPLVVQLDAVRMRQRQSCVELRMTYEEANAFILANRGKVPAAFNPKCVDCVRFTENHGYTAACVACYSSKHPCADEQVTSAKACIMEALAVVWPQQQCVRGLASCAGAS